jgi:hypothetical protein
MLVACGTRGRLAGWVAMIGSRAVLAAVWPLVEAFLESRQTPA